MSDHPKTEPKRMRILDAGFENYTGPIGPIEFENGVSVYPVPEPFATRIAASMKMVEIDSDGEETPAGIAHRLVADAAMRAPVLDPLDRQSDDEKRQENAEAAKKAILASEPAKIYSREELEAILEKDGIKGLREIGDFWNVKHRMAVMLLEMILEKQSAWAVARDERIAKAASEEPTIPVSEENPPIKEGETASETIDTDGADKAGVSEDK